MTDRPLAPTRAQLEDLEARHVAFLEARLRSPRAREEWRANVGAVLADLLRTPLGEVIEAQALGAAIEAALSRPLFDEIVRPALEQIAAEAHAHAMKAPDTIGTVVPPAARKRMEALLARPDVLPPKLIREIAVQDAAHEVMRDVLYDALKQFSERVNPFVADWGLPALLKKLGPFAGGLGKGLDGTRMEFERRLDPEIRRFLQGFSSKALRDMAESVITRGDTPPFVAFRQRLGSFLLEQRLSDVLLDATGTREAAAVGLDIAAHVLADEEMKKKRRALVDGWIAANASTPLGDIVAKWGLPRTPPAALIEALADATFPAFSAAIATPAAKQWLASVTAEFYDGITASDEPARAEG
ncbi:hypothetical protein [Polyangium aurulentum]|uniref:hypothetical protein n=1 Tax=Polyangium aurulentum TaxID=2567896 RepID=UPI0010ADC5F5|nr:hypothetical protein [Polyangium aurulentum]UQA61148.1 hypothetical protein E8A73_011980 [Polyangium aurulentum]